jgi:hypothetical protein
MSANDVARALISMMVRSHDELQSETGYIDARPHHPDRQIFLHRTAGPYIQVKCGTTRNEHISSEMRSRADIRHPFCSSGGNLGNGRTRTAMYIDSIEQPRGTASARQVKIRAETALAAFTTPSNGGWIMFGEHPS